MCKDNMIDLEFTNFLQMYYFYIDIRINLVFTTSIRYKDIPCTGVIILFQRIDNPQKPRPTTSLARLMVLQKSTTL